MTSGKRKAFYALVALQLVFVLLIASSNFLTESLGQEVRLKTAPVDPRDLLMGDYVRLGYDISRVPESKWKGNARPEGGDAVYAVLRQNGNLHELSAAYPSKPKLAPGEIALKGKAGYSGSGDIRVEYGIEEYYVPENTGREIEKNRSKTIVVLKAAPWGQFHISRLEQ